MLFNIETLLHGTLLFYNFMIKSHNCIVSNQVTNQNLDDVIFNQWNDKIAYNFKLPIKHLWTESGGKKL